LLGKGCAWLAHSARAQSVRSAKQIGKEALGPSGLTVADDEISPDAHHADLRHEPDPTRDAERARLGFLGRLASVPCLLEAFGHAPDAEEFRACLAKHIAFWQQRTRKARRAKKSGEEASALVEPFLWILAARSPTAILRGLALTPGSGWPSGVYLRSEILRFGIVVDAQSVADALRESDADAARRAPPGRWRSRRSP
jgi:hypothetical protein